MPLFDYRCTSCSNQFEFLVLRGQEPRACPQCGAATIEKQLSLPSVKSESTKAKAMAAAQKRDQAQARDRAHEQARYERSHND